MLLLGCGGDLQKARQLEAAGDLEGAIASYEAVLNESPDSVEALRGLAVALYLVGDFDGALPYQERVIALDSTDVQTRIELGFNYLNHQSRPSEAVKILSAAVALERSAKHLAFLAQAQLVSGDEDAGEASLREAVEIDPEYAYAYMLLVQLLESRGMHSEADSIRRSADKIGVDIEP